MKLRRFIPIVLILLGLVAISGCKKDKKDKKTKPSLKGSITFAMPKYVLPDEKMTVTQSGVSHPNNKGVGIYWKLSVKDAKRDTVRTDSEKFEEESSYSFVSPNKLGNFTLFCTAFAEGYYDTSVSHSFTVVSPDTSIVIKNKVPEEKLMKYTDTRDGQEYDYIHVGNLDWFAENLKYTEIGKAYVNEAVMGKVLGMYYNYNDAVSACPEGWRLPTEEDWVDLAKSASEKDNFESLKTFEGIAGDIMSNGTFNDQNLWEFWPEVKITNKSGLTVLPFGFATISAFGHNFKGYNTYAAFWTADKCTNESDNGFAYYRYIHVKEPNIAIGKGDMKSFYTNVRCVR